MAGTISLEPPAPARTAERAYAEAASIPWYIWCCVVSVLSAVIGSAWDISWHESVGRDTFWTPAHMMIYLSGVLAGISCGNLILFTTLEEKSTHRDFSISMWNNGWHTTYGLDVKMLSTPHVLLALGMIGIRFGTLVMVLAEVNRAHR